MTTQTEPHICHGCHEEIPIDYDEETGGNYDESVVTAFAADGATVLNVRYYHTDCLLERLRFRQDDDWEEARE